MSSDISPSALKALEASATTAAAYLDACDMGAQHVRLDPDYYLACGEIISKIFAIVDAEAAFPLLVKRSAAAQEVVQAIQIKRRIEVSRTGFYPELAVLLHRAAA